MRPTPPPPSSSRRLCVRHRFQFALPCRLPSLDVAVTELGGRRRTSFTPAWMFCSSSNIAHLQILQRSPASRPSEKQIEAAVVVRRAAVAEVQRSDRGIRAQENAGRFEHPRRRTRNEWSAIASGFQRKAGVDTLEQFLPDELVVIRQPREAEPVRDQRACAIAGLLEEAAPLEQVVARKCGVAELASGLDSEVEGVIAQRPYRDSVGIPFGVGIVRTERSAR